MRFVVAENLASVSMIGESRAPEAVQQNLYARYPLSLVFSRIGSPTTAAYAKYGYDNGRVSLTRRRPPCPTATNRIALRSLGAVAYGFIRSSKSVLALTSLVVTTKL